MSDTAETATPRPAPPPPAPRPPDAPASATSSTPPSKPSEAPGDPAKSAWPKPSPAPSPAANTSSSKQAPAPANPSPTSSPPSPDAAASSSPPPPSPCNANSSNATSPVPSTPSTPNSAAAPPSPPSRAAATTSASTASTTAPPTKATNSSNPRPPRKSAATSSASATGPTTPKPATATTSAPASTTAPGPKSPSPQANASAQTNAPTAKTASPNAPATSPNNPTSSSPTTPSSPSTPSKAPPSSPNTKSSSSTKPTELAARVTAVATDDLTIGTVERAARRAAKLANEKAVDALQTAAEAYAKTMGPREPARINEPDADLGWTLAALRDACRAVITSLGEVRDKTLSDEDASRRQAMASAQSIHDTCERILGGSPYDVLWVERNDRVGPSLRIAPLAVAGLLRDALFGDRTVVLTSATLKLGGDFTGVARTLGLNPEGLLPEPGATVPVTAVQAAAKPAADRDTDDDTDAAASGTTGTSDQEDADPDNDTDLAVWRSLDVGSPYDYPRQGILYVAKHLPPPGRDGMHPDTLDELAELIECAGGRTLGLFSSRRAAEAATEALRERLDLPILCQGDDSLPELLKTFADDTRTCLFGTLSLWQGVDVPGPSCQLVVMDRIPFPRPDDPLMAARAQAVHQAGGNGFMAVSATHAALLMAQGAGRLIRAGEDRGVVAVLDSRLATARYGGFFRASMPDFWYTTDRNQVRKSLAAIDT
ncbi:ATP-dependent DNA helicase [Yinghuangia aomiensis]